MSPYKVWEAATSANRDITDPRTIARLGFPIKSAPGLAEQMRADGERREYVEALLPDWDFDGNPGWYVHARFEGWHAETMLPCPSAGYQPLAANASYARKKEAR